MKRILVVDDEPSIVTLLTYNIKQAGYQVESTDNGRDALEKVRNQAFDFVVLDVMLPGMDGMDVCRAIRADKIEVPILMLTAKAEEYDRIIGLELGADDYLTKPFSPREVVARIKAILRRTEKQAPHLPEQVKPHELKVGQIKLFPDLFEAYLGETMLELTPKEFQLLAVLMEHAGRIISRDQLLDQVWDYDYSGESRIVDIHISHLRDKLELDPKKPAYIQTVRGFGYRMKEPQDAT